MTQTAVPKDAPLVPTGVPLLDSALDGGVQPGSLIFAMGEPTSGMELLAKQFAASNSGEPVLVWSPDESEAEWRAVMGRFGDPTSVTIVDISREYFERLYGAVRPEPDGIEVRGILPAAKRAQPQPRGGEASIPDFLDQIVKRTRKMQPRRTVIDTLDFFSELYSTEEIVRTLRGLRIVNRDAGGVLLVTKIKGTSEPRLEKMIEHVADVVLDFHVEASQQDFIWRLTVKKVRNEPQRAGSVLYNPTPTGLARDTRRRV